MEVEPPSASLETAVQHGAILINQRSLVVRSLWVDNHALRALVMISSSAVRVGELCQP